jgi:hypothetical protein
VKLLLTLTAAYLTANDVADAVMEYDLALSRAQKIDAISMPFIDAAEIQREAQFTIGWQTGTSTITHPQHAGDELHAEETIRSLKAKAAALTHSTAQPPAISDAPIDWPRFD